jgi:hypothetical protein
LARGDNFSSAWFALQKERGFFARFGLIGLIINAALRSAFIIYFVQCRCDSSCFIFIRGNRLALLYGGLHFMAGSGVRPKNVAAATTSIATAINNNVTRRKFGLVNRGPTCYGFDLVFALGGDVTTSGDAHGRAPLFKPVITFLPSRHRSKVDRFINRRGTIGLVGFAVPTSPIRASLYRFRVGLMAEIPARENFKNTKTSKTS